MNWEKRENNALMQALRCVNTDDEMRRFLRDLLTEGEIEEFAKRFSAAQMLSDGVPYSSIEKSTGLSSTTIARVSKWLNGKGEGYKTVIARIHHPQRTPARGLN
jgi:TrpR-related protein YerC/YecD